VLYARRGHRVVGRCLYALTDGLALLAFQPYCHEQLDFASIVRDHAHALATRMRTVVAARGPVSTLLSRDWYDDGARDLAGRFERLAGLDLDAIAPEELIARLREALGRELDDVSLPLVIGLPQLHGRPRHLRVLVPFLLASSVAELRLTAAQLALDGDDAELADRLLGDHDRAIDVTDHAWPRGEILARLRPTVALARLRRTRARGVRRWSDERADRIALAGVAFEALARPRQAAAMYRLAMRREDWVESPMRVRLAALGEPVEGELAD